MLVRIHNQVLCKATENLLVDNLLIDVLARLALPLFKTHFMSD